MNAATEQLLLHLYNCIDFGFSYRARKGFFIPDHLPYNWKTNKEKIRDAIRDLNKYKFIKKKQNYDGSVLVSLTEKGRLRALNVSFKNFYNRKEKWDGKWRMVAFDIPEEQRKGRKAIVYRFRCAGFYELQKSLFLYPYDCEKEIRALIELFKLQKYVTFGLLESIDGQKRIEIVLGLNQ